MCSLTAVLERVIIKPGTTELLLLFPQVLYTLTRANTLRALPATHHAAVNPPYRGKAGFTVTQSNMGEASTERAK